MLIKPCKIDIFQWLDMLSLTAKHMFFLAEIQAKKQRD